MPPFRADPLSRESLLSHEADRAAPGDSSAERDWVAAIRRGDESAFAALFTAHYEMLWALVNEYVHAPDAAEEIVQDVFLRIWEQRETWTVQRSVRGYLYTAARNRALDYLRRQRLAQRWEETAAREADPAQATGEDLESRFAAAELSAAIDDAIADLSPPLREVLVLRSRHHLTYPEIARVLDVPLKTVETRVTRAFKALRESLRPYLP